MSSKSGRIDLRFSSSDFNMIDSVWAPCGFKSRGVFAKEAVRLVASRVQDGLRLHHLEDGDIERVFDSLSGGFEDVSSVDWDGFYRAAASRDRLLSLSHPRGSCNAPPHPFATRFLGEEFGTLLETYPCVSTCSGLSRDDLIQNTTLRLLDLGANGCNTYDEYRAKAFKVYGL